MADEREEQRTAFNEASRDQNLDAMLATTQAGRHTRSSIVTDEKGDTYLEIGRVNNNSTGLLPSEELWDAKQKNVANAIGKELGGNGEAERVERGSPGEEDDKRADQKSVVYRIKIDPQIAEAKIDEARAYTHSKREGNYDRFLDAADTALGSHKAVDAQKEKFAEQQSKLDGLREARDQGVNIPQSEIAGAASERNNARQELRESRKDMVGADNNLQAENERMRHVPKSSSLIDAIDKGNNQAYTDMEHAFADRAKQQADAAQAKSDGLHAATAKQETDGRKAENETRVAGGQQALSGNDDAKSAIKNLAEISKNSASTQGFMTAKLDTAGRANGELNNQFGVNDSLKSLSTLAEKDPAEFSKVIKESGMSQADKKYLAANLLDNANKITAPGSMGVVKELLKDIPSNSEYPSPKQAENLVRMIEANEKIGMESGLKGEKLDAFVQQKMKDANPGSSSSTLYANAEAHAQKAELQLADMKKGKESPEETLKTQRAVPEGAAPLAATDREASRAVVTHPPKPPEKQISGGHSAQGDQSPATVAAKGNAQSAGQSRA